MLSDGLRGRNSAHVPAIGSRGGLRSCTEAQDVFKQSSEFTRVGRVGQIGQKSFFEHFLGNRASSIGMRWSTRGIVPRTVAAVRQVGFGDVPRTQFDQRIHPLIQVPAADVRPDVSDLLLPRSPDFLDVVTI